MGRPYISVTNRSDAIITVKTILSDSYDFLTDDSVHVIKQGESKKIIDELGTVCGLREYPESWYIDGDTVPMIEHKFDIYVI